MVTKLVLDKRAKKDGTCAIKVSVHTGGKTKYIPTGVSVLPSEFNNGRVIRRPDSARINTRLMKKVGEIEEGINEIDYIECLDADELVTLINESAEMKNPTIQQAFDKWLSMQRCSENSENVYKSTLKMTSEYIPASSLLQRLTLQTLMQAEKKMVKAGLKRNTIRLRMTLLRGVYKLAYNEGWIKVVRNPFKSYKMPKVAISDNWLSVEEIRLIRDMDVETKYEEFGKDMFMLSYYLGGLNPADISIINFNRDNVSFIRRKVAGRVDEYTAFGIHPKAAEIIDKWKGEDGLIHHPFKTKKFSSLCCRKAKDLSNDIGIKFTFGSARKSVAQHLLDIGCPSMIIDYTLGHSKKSGEILYRYVSVKPETATEWLWKVIDQL